MTIQLEKLIINRKEKLKAMNITKKDLRYFEIRQLLGAIIRDMEYVISKLEAIKKATQ